MNFSSLSDALPCVSCNAYKKIVSSLTAGVLAAGLLLSTSLAQAATVVLDGFIATGITDLDVDPGPGVQLYDVDFIQTTAEALYGIHPATTFPFSLAESLDANDAILAALNGSVATSVGPDSGTSELEYAFMILSDENDRGSVSFIGPGGSFVFGGTGWVNDPATPGDTAVLIYADFTPVPVPAAVWLFGSGLICLVGIARRKQANRV